MYANETTIFGVEQIMGMLLTKLKTIAEVNLNKPVQDCVVSVSSLSAERKNPLFFCCCLVDDGASFVLKHMQ